MNIAIESPQRGVTVIRPSGTLDMNSVPAFRPTLEKEVRAATAALLVSLEGIQFMDSAGVAVLIEGLKWSRSRHLPFLLVQPTPAVQMVIELARLEHIFTIAASLEAALATLPPAP